MSRVRRIPDAPGLQLEAALLAGGLRALLLQLAHPAVGHGVAEHSDFAADPLARLRGTLAYVYVIAAGDDRTARAVTSRIDRLHARVVSDPGSAVAYDAADSGLQFWVTATIADTALRIADAVWGPLPAPLADELLARLGRIGTALGMPAEQWPSTRIEFDAAFADAAHFDSRACQVSADWSVRLATWSTTTRRRSASSAASAQSARNAVSRRSGCASRPSASSTSSTRCSR